MSSTNWRYKLADAVARLTGKLPPYVLARVVANMAKTGKGTDACLGWGALPMPVHYYSPVPDISDLRRRKIWSRRSSMAGVDFRPEQQKALLIELGREYGRECRWPARREEAPGGGFYTENGCFSFGCAASTHCVIRHFRPRRVVEIGSGNSSMVIAGALRLNAGDGAEEQHYRIIDPYPSRPVVEALGGVADVLPQRVELAGAAVFDELDRDDVLFMDSSHTVRTGGDVNHLFLDVIPGLKPGVIVHVHDIALPYEYPEVYFTNPAFRVFWTEAYLLQAFLSCNHDFEVLLAMYWLQHDYPDVFGAAFPLFDANVNRAEAASFWFRRKT